MNQASIAIAVEAVMPTFRASGLAVSLCTIQAPDASDEGAPSGDYTDVAGLVDLVCMDAPEGLGSGLSAEEIKAMAQTESMARRHVLLDDYYPQLSPETNWGDVGWIAVVTNTKSGEVATYDIIGSEADSQATQSRLCLRKVTT